jgi:hypothetical protein
MDVSDAKLVEERIELVRNLAAHAGDAYSLLTGAPIDSTRRKNVPRDRLVPATTRADAALAASAIARVAAGLLTAADANGYEPEANFT